MDIVLKNITKNYSQEAVIKNLSLTLEGGKLTSLLGPSGCGKTTLLNLIAGVIPPSNGEIFFGEENVTDVPIQERNIGYVFQSYSLYPNMTVYDNIKFPLTNLKNLGMKRKEKNAYFDSEIHKIASLLKIEDLLKRSSSELSGGQKQRVAIARTLIRKPQILLMDEPFANLDKKLSITMREEIREIQQNLGITTIFVTHNQSDANAISDKIVLMNNGEIQQIGTSEQLYLSPNNLFVADFFGNYDINKINGKYCDGHFISNNASIEIPCQYKNAVTVAFRPEDVILTDKQNSYFTARVKTAIYEGKSLLYSLEAGDETFYAYIDKLLHIGQEVFISVKKEHLLCFDSNEKRI